MSINDIELTLRDRGDESGYSWEFEIDGIKFELFVNSYVWQKFEDEEEYPEIPDLLEDDLEPLYKLECDWRVRLYLIRDSYHSSSERVKMTLKHFRSFSSAITHARQYVRLKRLK